MTAIGRSRHDWFFARICVLVLGVVIAAVLIPRGAAAADQETVLYSFCAQTNCTDGYSPSGLIMDGAGNLYGTTAEGGVNNAGGTVFKLTPNQARTAWTETVLYSFCSQSGCADGNNSGSPNFNGLVMDGAGNLYGSTRGGGAHGGGLVFELAPNPSGGWTYTVLYSFCAQMAQGVCGDGRQPLGALIMDGAGNLYGITEIGGNPGFWEFALTVSLSSAAAWCSN